MKKIILILLLVSITGCSDNSLSRSEAQTQLQAVIKEGTLEKRMYTMTDQDALASRGYLRWTDRRWGNNFSGGVTREKFVLEEGAKKYLISTKWQGKSPIYLFRIGTRSFGEITGISQIPESNEAMVEYTIKTIMNDFGKDVLSREDKIETKKVKFIRYDDGWRFDKK